MMAHYFDASAAQHNEGCERDRYFINGFNLICGRCGGQLRVVAAPVVTPESCEVPPPEVPEGYDPAEWEEWRWQCSGARMSGYLAPPPPKKRTAN